MIKVRLKGLQDYLKTWEEMKSFTENRDSDTLDELWTLEHNSVFTQGLSGKPEHLLKKTQIPIIQKFQIKGQKFIEYQHQFLAKVDQYYKMFK